MYLSTPSALTFSRSPGRAPNPRRLSTCKIRWSSLSLAAAGFLFAAFHALGPQAGRKGSRKQSCIDNVAIAFRISK
jgi:hypothetical protein